MARLLQRESAMKLGDKIQGLYHGDSFEGTIDSFDMSGWAYVTLTVPCGRYGVGEQIGIDPNWRRTCSVVEEGPAIDPEAVTYDQGLVWICGTQPAT